jgi:4-phytase/acid phosphatase
VAEGLDPAEPPPHGFAAAGTVDPLFDGLADSACKLDPSQAVRAVQAQAPLTTPAVDAGLARLQQIVAPTACTGGAGACLTGPSSVSPGGREVKLAGPLATGATLAENLLLEYQDGLPMTQVGWGRMSPADLATVMPVHDRAADLTRATPYIAVRRAGAISRLILAVLNDRALATAAPTVDPGRRLVVLVGHDTNLSNLAGAFGLRWSLPGQPDATAPGVALAFERWRDSAGGEQVKVRVFYQTPDEVRSLSPDVESLSVTPDACGPSDAACALAPFTARIEAAIPAGCGG